MPVNLIGLLGAAECAVAFEAVRVSQPLSALRHVRVCAHVDVRDAERLALVDGTSGLDYQSRHPVDLFAVCLAAVVEKRGAIEVDPDANGVATRSACQAVESIGIDLARKNVVA